MGNAPTARVSNRASFDIFNPLSSCLTNSLWKTMFARAKFLERSSSSWGCTYWRKRTRNHVKKIDGLIGEPNWAREGQIYFWSCIHLKERINSNFRSTSLEERSLQKGDRFRLGRGIYSGSSSSLEVKSIPSRVSVGGQIIRSRGRLSITLKGRFCVLRGCRYYPCKGWI